jgi:hypothetical protein
MDDVFARMVSEIRDDGPPTDTIPFHNRRPTQFHSTKLRLRSRWPCAFPTKPQGWCCTGCA